MAWPVSLRRRIKGNCFCLFGFVQNFSSFHHRRGRITPQDLSHGRTTNVDQSIMTMFPPRLQSWGKMRKSKPKIRPSVSNSPERTRFKFLLNDALCLYHDMVRMVPLPYELHFNQLLGLIVKMEKYPIALSHFKGMCVPIDVYTMTIAINCFFILKRVDFGLSILGSFFKPGHKPNVITFGTLIKVFFRESCFSGAHILLQRIFIEKLCEANDFMCGTLIDGGFAREGIVETPLNYFKYWSNCKPNVIIYNTIIDSCCKDKYVDVAHALLA